MNTAISELGLAPNMLKKLENYVCKATVKSLVLNNDIEKRIYEEFGCNVLDLVGQMYDEQREQNYANPPSSYVKHRRVVVEWMLDVCDYFHLHPTTTHLSIAFLDRIQPNEKYSRFEWQMIAICCIVIASKYNECECHVPELEALEEITHQQIPNATFLSYELWTLKRMGWKLHARTPMNFLNCYMNLGIVSNNDIYCYDSSHNLIFDAHRPTCITSDSAVCGGIPEVIWTSLLPRYIYVLSNICLTEMELKRFLANDIACAVIYISSKNIHLSPVWTEELMLMTGCEDPSIVGDVIAMMDQLSMTALETHFQHETLPVPVPASVPVSLSHPVSEIIETENSDFEYGQSQSGSYADCLNDTVSFDAELDGRSDSDCEVTAISGGSDLNMLDNSQDEELVGSGVEVENSVELLTQHENAMNDFTKYLHNLTISSENKTKSPNPMPPHPPQNQNLNARIGMIKPTHANSNTIPVSLEKGKKHVQLKLQKSADVISPQSVSLAISSPPYLNVSAHNNTNNTSKTNAKEHMVDSVGKSMKDNGRGLKQQECEHDVVRSSIDRLIS